MYFLASNTEESAYTLFPLVVLENVSCAYLIEMKHKTQALIVIVEWKFSNRLCYFCSSLVIFYFLIVIIQ